MNDKTCDFDGCGKPRRARGYCEAHYAQLKRGKPLTPTRPKPLPTEARYASNVNKTANCWEWTGRKHRRGYGTFFFDGKDRPAHQYALKRIGKHVSPGMVVDHLCHNLSCVNPAHLRVVTQQANSHNIAGLAKNNTSGYRGVSRNGSGWVARVRLDGTLRTLGTYPTAEEAGRVASDYRTRHMGLWDSVAQAEWRAAT